MKKIVLVVAFLFLINPLSALAADNDCYKTSDCTPNEVCVPKKVTPAVGTSPFLCQAIAPGPASAFGKIEPPDAIKALGVGSIGISKFFNNLISLIYIIAAVVFIFMLLWGAIEWLTSGGDKEKLASARNRIIHALIGIVLFAIAFAIIRVVGTFTGFQFYSQ